MNPIDLVVTVCAVLSPATCEERHLVFHYSGSPRQCAMAAPPYIAQWVGEHPKWHAVKWRCEISAPERQGVSCQNRFERYLVQSFRSLSAIENTASALISISRTTHCRALG
ncbi:hypothetical protein ABIA06_002783 [Bradyrhizobium yuanmingense]